MSCLPRKCGTSGSQARAMVAATTQTVRKQSSSISPVLVIVLFLVSSASISRAQFVQLPHYIPVKKAVVNARTRQLEAMPLPFWDDFSTAVKDTTKAWVKAADSLWSQRGGTRITDGAGIKPRSIGVAVFDGLDSIGKPYELDLITSGFSDGLVSQPLKLGDVLPANRDSVYLSFAYQWKGYGEAPDPADYLQVDFKNETGTWEPVSIISGAGLPGGQPYNPELFYDFIVKVSLPRFFHNAFQFRIVRYGRRSGPFDTWIVDYVYLNEHRFENDLSFTDRSLATHLTNLFNGYRSVPLDHFFEAATINKPSMNVANLQNGSTVLEYNSFVNSASFAKGTIIGESPVIPLDVKLNIDRFLNFSRKDIVINTLPDPFNLSLFNPQADSLLLTLKIELKSGDNVPIGTPVVPPNNQNPDYNPRIYAPIDFRSNDTTFNHYTLSQYYAYDDGTAEYSAGLAQGGNLAAVRFTQLPDASDTLTGVFIYFPQLAGLLSNTVDILIYADNNGLPGELLGEETVSARRLGVDVFHKVKFRSGILVPKTFYIGWREPLNGKIAIGLDKSTDNSDKIFSNGNGSWIRPANVTGTLMIRPIFGKKAPVIITSIENDTDDIALYPNPVESSFSINAIATVEAITTITGTSLPFSTTNQERKTLVTLNHTVAGLATVHIRINDELVIKKILVR
jgi:hypothetical protein